MTLDKQLLAATTGLPVSHLHLFSQVDSTMTVAEQTELTGFHLIVAERMTAGRGQRGHSFTAPQTGMYVTIVTPVLPPFLTQPGLLTMGVAAATHQAIARVLHVTTQLKWVNDLYYHDHKVGGILVEVKNNSRNQPENYLIGIGLNLAPHRSLAAVQATALTTDLHARDQLIAEVYRQVVAFLRQPKVQTVQALYNQHLLWRNQVVQVTVNHHLYQGLIQGLDQQLGLELVDQDGHLHQLTAEAATHLRPVR
ncbi:biotin--[acetyl-CoA-carboxylase] ligase [Fructilactobacillus myrtifloralis]|uniref:Biotin--[acetyl-CoA-carboxylase] ligase n=1 Tax=Fructilactobacillus myrtifloralis TaxID=2940301 RepID=A0ABY5BP97_9LACO|nr:biotin--[acetyl-CoA-carboxylase] ligase [Fructilactobacillus myrtifloralis]USS84786.1 biotin--[acetyl-CoA-carboxylase] ligase [Fructilactobacillus myrtifloralis]